MTIVIFPFYVTSLYTFFLRLPFDLRFGFLRLHVQQSVPFSPHTKWESSSLPLHGGRSGSSRVRRAK